MKKQSIGIAILLITANISFIPQALAAGNDDLNNGLIQRLMVGSSKSCQVVSGKSEEKIGSKNKASDLAISAQKVIDQLTVKNTTTTLAAAATLKTGLTTYTSTKSTISTTYSTTISLAQNACNVSVAALKKSYDQATLAAKVITKGGKQSESKSQKKSAQDVYQNTIAAATASFKAGAQTQLTALEKAIKDAAAAQKTAQLALDSQFSAAIQTAKALLA